MTLFVKETAAPFTQLDFANYNAIQDDLVAANGATWQPTMVGIDDGDISVRRGWYNRMGGLATMRVALTWNNTDGGTAGDAVQVDLPWQAADYSGGGGPLVSYGLAHLTFSVWPDSATDRAIQGVISHNAGFDVMTVQRISTTNTSPGNMTNDTAAARQIGIEISYPTDGVFLL